MFRKSLLRSQPVAASVAIASVVALVGAILQGNALTGMNWLGITGRAQATDVSVQFIDSTFSLSKSTFDVQVSSSLPPPENGSLPVVLEPGSIGVNGVENLRPVYLAGTSRLDAQTVVFHLEAGPPEAGVGAVELTVRTVFLMSDKSTSVVNGPWSYEAPVDQATLAADSRVVEINQSVSGNGLLVSVSEARVTKDEILVRYTLTAPAGYVGPIGPPAQIRLPSGEVVKGHAVGPTRGRTGDLAVAFPPLPPETKAFDLEFGPYAAAKPGVTIGIDVPVDSPVLMGAGSLPIGETVSSPAGDITVAALHSTGDRFALEFSAAAGGSLPAAVSPDATVVASGGTGGKTYQASSLAVQFARGADGTPFFKSAVAEFGEPLPADWTHFDLTIDKTWLELDLPMFVTVSLE